MSRPKCEEKRKITATFSLECSSDDCKNCVDDCLEISTSEKIAALVAALNELTGYTYIANPHTCDKCRHESTCTKSEMCNFSSKE
jgi:hypothetical protein